MISVRRAGPADIPEIVRLKALLMVDGWPGAVELDETWHRRCADIAAELLASPHYACFVVDRPTDDAPGAGVAHDSAAGSGARAPARSASALASCVSVSVEQHLPGPHGSGRSAYVGDMATDVDLRGRGYGRVLLDAALQWCREQEAGWVSLFSTESGNALYRSAGFSDQGPFQHLSMAL